jgi:phosphoglycolate phosphatase
MLEPPLLFDLDGTLVDSLPDIAASVNRVRAAFALPELPAVAVRGMVGDGLAKLLERALPGLDDEQLRAATQIYRAHHEQQCTRLVRPFANVVPRLQQWHAEGVPMAVVTNKPRRFAELILDALALRRYLPVLVDGDSLADRKPSPEPCRLALRELGSAPGRGTMIGDGVQDLRAGKAAGLRTTAALFGYRDAAALRAEGADQFWVAFGVPEP